MSGPISAGSSSAGPPVAPSAPAAGGRSGADPGDGGTGDGVRSRDLTRLARGSALNLAGSLVNAAGSFLLVVIVTRNLGPGASGAFLLATALFQVLATAGQAGADTGLGRFIPWSLTHGRVDQLRRWTLFALLPVGLLGLVTGTIAYVGAEPLARLVAKGDHRDDFVTYVRVLAPFVAVGAIYFTIQTGSRAFGTMRPSVVVERLARPLLQPVAMALVLGLGLGPVAVAWAWIGPYAAAAAALALWYATQIRNAERRRGLTSARGGAERRDAAQPPGGAAGNEHPLGDEEPEAAEPPGGAAPTQNPMGKARTALGGADVTARTARGGADVTASVSTFWRFSSPRALAGVFQVAVQWLDVLLVGALASTREAGIYSASSRWLVGGLFVVFAINQAFQPQISAMLARADLARATSIFESATAWGVALVWPLYLVLALFGPVLVRVFGAGFGEGADALAILAVGGMVAAACGPVDMVLLMGGRSAYSLFTAATGLIVNVVANVTLVPRYGIVGAAVAWSASLWTINVLAAVQVRRRIGLFGYGPIWRRSVVAALVGGGVPLLIVRLVVGATVPGLVIGIVVAALVYGFTLWHWRDALHADLLTAAFRSRRGRGAFPASTGHPGPPGRSSTRAPSDKGR